MNNEYPRDSELREIKKWDVIKGNLPEFVDYIKSLWWMPEWGFKLYRGREHIFRQWCMKLELHTGGWSGNEDVIGTLQGTFFWTLFWQKSIRGGHYWFEFPMQRWKRDLPLMTEATGG